MPARRKRFVGALSLAAGAVLVAPLVVTASPSSAKVTFFDSPSAIVAIGKNLWVTNEASNNVVEIPSTGADVPGAIVTGNFAHPVAEVADGADLFVAGSNRITEISTTTDQIVRTIQGASFDLTPTALTVVSGDVVVADGKADAVTIFNASTGKLVGVLKDSSKHPDAFDDPAAITQVGSTAWVANEAGNSVTEVKISPSPKLVTTFSGGSYGFDAPDGIVYDGSRVWVANQDTATVTVFSAPSGANPVVITNSSGNENYGFMKPGPMAVGGGMVYVVSPPGSSPMVTQISETATTQSGGVSYPNGNWYECNTNDPTPGFVNPQGVAVLGSHVWVANTGANQVSELKVSDGSFLGGLS